MVNQIRRSWSCLAIISLMLLGSLALVWPAPAASLPQGEGEMEVVGHFDGLGGRG